MPREQLRHASSNLGSVRENPGVNTGEIDQGALTYDLPWTDHTSGQYISGLTLTSNSNYSVEARALDILGNASTANSATWLVDATPPTVATNLTLGLKPRTLTESSTFSWTGCQDPSGGAGGVTATVQLVKVSDQTILASSTSFTSGGKFSGLALEDATTYGFTIQCSDSLGNSNNLTTSAYFTTNLIQFTRACAGGSTLCGVTASGALKCWGGNFPSIPTVVSGYENGVNDVACHEDRVMVVKLGILSSLTSLNIPNGLPTGIEKVYFGMTDLGFNSYNACVSTATDVWCWGQGSSAGMGGCGGGNSVTPCSTPHVVNGILGAYKIELGYWNGCAQMSPGPNAIAKCWGKTNTDIVAPFSPDSYTDYNPNNNTYATHYAAGPTNVNLSVQGLSLNRSIGVLLFGQQYNPNGTYLWGVLPGSGYPTQFYVNTQGAIDMTIDYSYTGYWNQALLYPDGSVQTRTSSLSGNGGGVSPSCGDTAERLLSFGYYFNTSGFIKQIGNCADISN